MKKCVNVFDLFIAKPGCFWMYLIATDDVKLTDNNLFSTIKSGTSCMVTSITPLKPNEPYFVYSTTYMH